MIKKFILSLTLLFLLNGITAKGVAAQQYEIRSYLITEEQEIIGNPNLTSPYLIKLFSMVFRSGKVVLSANPDGTGAIDVEERFVANVSTPNAQSFAFEAGCPHRLMPPLDITHLLVKGNQFNNLTFAYVPKSCRAFRKIDGVTKEYAQLGRLYLVHFDDYNPDVPQPFLNLPWNYQNSLYDFTSAALNMSSYFDHEYPLLSTLISESLEAKDSTVVFFDSNRGKKSYSSHDGYDWALSAGAKYGETALAAASGQAEYVNTCGACGNAIHIDHGNGYQSRYYHLQFEGLISTIPFQKVAVTQGQPVGKIGYTGNVIPHGEGGAHIHFMVIHDKNGDGNFEDNIPDGIVDPFGWLGEGPDPWETYSGTKSHYLWKTPITSLAKTLGVNGGTFNNGKYTLSIPKSVVNFDTVLKMEQKPAVTINLLQSIGTVMDIVVDDGFGTPINAFSKSFKLLINFSQFDISRYKPESISIYSTSDGEVWNKETSTIDFLNKQASADVNHLTDFSLMGEKLDSMAPISTVLLSGVDIGGTFVSQVDLTIEATDEPELDSLGIDYTMVKVSTEDWKEYIEPVSFSEENDYVIEYFSADKDGNIEDVKSLQFSVVAPTPTFTPTPTPSPTSTPTPTPTETPIPTVTPTPTATPTPSNPGIKPSKQVIIKKIIVFVISLLRRIF